MTYGLGKLRRLERRVVDAEAKFKLAIEAGDVWLTKHRAKILKQRRKLFHRAALNLMP